jgi:hypothetical protein
MIGKSINTRPNLSLLTMYLKKGIQSNPKVLYTLTLRSPNFIAYCNSQVQINFPENINIPYLQNSHYVPAAWGKVKHKTV